MHDDLSSNLDAREKVPVSISGSINFAGNRKNAVSNLIVSTSASHTEARGFKPGSQNSSTDVEQATSPDDASQRGETCIEDMFGGGVGDGYAYG